MTAAAVAEGAMTRGGACGRCYELWTGRCAWVGIDSHAMLCRLEPSISRISSSLQKTGDPNVCTSYKNSSQQLHSAVVLNQLHKTTSTLCAKNIPVVELASMGPRMKNCHDISVHMAVDYAT